MWDFHFRRDKDTIGMEVRNIFLKKSLKSSSSHLSVKVSINHDTVESGLQAQIKRKVEITGDMSVIGLKGTLTKAEFSGKKKTIQ